MNLFGKQFKIALLSIFVVEAFSLLGYFYPAINEIGFLALILITLILAIHKLEYGIWIVLAELFIGSKGYLFFFEHDKFTISIRIALWLAVMSVWLGKKILHFRQNKIAFFSSQFFPYFSVLFLFIAWGLINGLINNNLSGNIFFDFNGWAYFALIFPIYDVFLKEKGEQISTLIQIFIASALWLCLKTLALLYLFSHNIGLLEIYKWIRDTGIGEITQMQGGFYRIFIQSHLFVLILFFLSLVLIFNSLRSNAFNNKRNLLILFSSFFSLTTILIGFSRTFWVGLVVGLLGLYSYFIINKAKLKELASFTGVLLGVGVLSVGLVALLVKFPYPDPLGGFNTTDLFSERASQFSGEAGVSSRWALLPNLAEEIKDAPILGKGFGLTVTYISSDPRILSANPSGEYTTYAFEWGWFDIWLKLGLLGFLAYVFLIFRVFVSGLQSNNLVITGFAFGLLVLSAVNFFSPYSNHPLGIGFLIIISVIIDNLRTDDVASIA